MAAFILKVWWLLVFNPLGLAFGGSGAKHWYGRKPSHKAGGVHEHRWRGGCQR